MTNSLIGLGALLVVAFATGEARADIKAVEERRAGATSVRAYTALEGIYALETGVEVSRQLTRWLAVDAMAAKVAVGSDEGFQGHLHGRAVLGNRHRLSLGAGPSLLVVEPFGKVTLFDFELGYEFRAIRGLSFILAAGPTVSLDSSKPAACTLEPGGGWFDDGCFLQRESYHHGEWMGRVRLGLGASF